MVSSPPFPQHGRGASSWAEASAVTFSMAGQAADFGGKADWPSTGMYIASLLWFPLNCEAFVSLLG